jgi:hypothetical protein
MTAQPLPRWLWLNLVALAFSLLHVLIDGQIGLWGRSSPAVSPLQASYMLLISLIYALWGLSLAWTVRGEKAGMLGLFSLTLLWSFLANGVVAIFASPPPSAAAFPYQDIAHFGNALFGGLASYALWKALRSDARPAGWWPALAPFGLLVAIYAVESILFFAR